MTGPRRENRGRSAAAGNRRALLAAAREVFAEGGIDAPLHAVAKKAGVGQGSLYRHFPDRISLTLAVFEDNVVELEARAAQPGSTVEDLLALLTEETIESVAFVEMVNPVHEDARLAAIVERVEAALAGPLREAHRSGTVRESVGTGEIMLAVGMVAALVAKTPADRRRQVAENGWSLLRRGLRPEDP